MAAHTTEAAEIRKLRKKLRQIENLERLTRPLDEQEQIKVEKKYDIRHRLQDLLDRVDLDTPTITHPVYDGTPPTLSTPPLEGEQAEEETQHVVDRGRRGMEAEFLSRSSGAEGVDEEEGVKRSVPAGFSPESQHPAGDRSPEKPSKKGTKTSSKKTRTNEWVQVPVVVTELDGHSDLVTSVSIQGTTLVSASRDTTVKVWDLETGEETHSLGGHTEMVTSVLVLSPEETAHLNEEEAIRGDDSYIVSGSTDCTFKVWSLKSGKQVKSVYTFNPVTCVDYSYSAHLLITTSDGGKVELWDVRTASNVFSVRAHEDSVTGLKVLNYTVITSDTDGLVMVHEIREGSLVRVFVSEDVKPLGTRRVNRRTIRSLTASDQLVVFGDDAVNLKLLDWRKGVVRKAVNHVSQFTSTDAVCMWEDVLLTSSYDLDCGYGYINIRSRSTGEYLASVDDEEEAGTERITCLAATRMPSGARVFVSGGAQLKVWQFLPPGHSVPDSSQEEKWVTVTQFLPALAQQPRDSDTESDMEGEGEEEEDTEEEEEDENDDGGRKRRQHRDPKEPSGAQSWMAWCSIV